MPCNFPVFLESSWAALLLALCALVALMKHQNSRLPLVVPCVEDDIAFKLRTHKENILKSVVKASILVSVLLQIFYFVIKTT